MLYELVMHGTYFGESVVNRFNYVSTVVTGTNNGAFGLAKAFGAVPDEEDETLPAAHPLAYTLYPLSDYLTLQRVVVRAAANYAPTDFYEVAYSTQPTGGQSGLGLSPTAAFGFRTNIVRTDIARGTKRLCGVSEASTSNAGLIDPAYYTYLNTICGEWEKTLTYTTGSDTTEYAPCVVSKKKYETPRGNNAYKYYPTLSEQLDHVALGVSWQYVTNVRTQRSRQYGNGV